MTEAEARALLEDIKFMYQVDNFNGFDMQGVEEVFLRYAAAPDLLKALVLAEDVLSRFPFSSEIWPNGTHPNTGIEQIRAAIAKATGDQCS